MPKTKNTQIYNLITNTAHSLFVEQGYTKTTYQSIENSCGIRRTLIQYYFPNKAFLALSFFERLLSETIAYINSGNMKSDNKFLNMFLIGQIHFSFLLKDDKIKHFTYDIISSRELTDDVLTFNYSWGLKYLDIKDGLNNSKLLDDIISTMGGFYELVYRCIKYNTEINIPYQLGKVIISIMENLGYSTDDAKQLILCDSSYITDFHTINHYLTKRLRNEISNQ